MRTLFTSVLVAASLMSIVLGSQSSTLVISGITIVDVVSGRTNQDMSVIIEGDRIIRVGNTVGTRAPAGARVIDGRGQFLIPGLWDMHVHLSYARASALPVLVANGVTGVRDMGSSLSDIDSWRDQITAAKIVGPHIARAGPILNGRQFNRYQTAVVNESDARIQVRSLQKAGVDFIKIHRQISRDAYFAIAEESKRSKLPFVGHVPTTVSPSEASAAGQKTLEHVETLFEGTFASATKEKSQPEAIREWIGGSEAKALFRNLVANGTAVTPTLITWQRLFRFLESDAGDERDLYVAASTKRETDETFKAIRANSAKFLAQQKPLVEEWRRVVPLMHQAGVTLLAGTDLAASYLHPGFSIHEEMQQLVEVGLTPSQALRTATINPARLFPDRAIGTIEPGKRADLVLLNGNPLTDIRNTQRINAVLLGGRLLDRKTLDQLLATAVELAKYD